MLRGHLVQPRPEVLQLSVHLQKHILVVHTAEGKCRANVVMYMHQEIEPLSEALMCLDLQQACHPSSGFLMHLPACFL